MNEWEIDYLRLSLRLDKHFAGYVDTYIGPLDLAEEVRLEQPSNPAQLTEDAEALLRRVPGLPYEIRRKEYLQKQVTAMYTIASKLAGQEYSYSDEIALCFDIHPKRIDEAVFEEAAEVLHNLLPAGETLQQRLQAWRQKSIVPPAKILSVLEKIRLEVQARTTSFLDLPLEESLELTLVQNKPWRAYNWYKGSYHSLIEFNTDLPITINDLTSTFCHEAYPGHHVEHIIHERDLLKSKNYGEYAVMLINTPECVISEGIGNIAPIVIFEREELYRWQAENLYPLIGVTQDPIKEFQISQALRAIEGVRGNVAFLYHEDGVPSAQAIDYLCRYSLRTPEEATQIFKFIASPLWRAYIFTYFYGEDILRNLLLRGDKQEIFQRLLTEHVYPSLLESGHWE